MKRIYTFLTFVMACLTASYAQDWQVTITKDDGLPGNESNGKCVFTSDVIKLDSPTATIRLTSISNDVYEKESGQSAAQNRLSAGICDVAQRRIFGNQHPILSIAELVIYDADGNSIAYTPSTNSPEPDGGFMAMFGMGGYQSPELDKIKDNNENTRYISTNYSLDTGVTTAWPNRFPYVELDLEEKVDEFYFKLVMPSGPHTTYLGITPGTDYMPYSDIEFTLGNEIKSTEEIEALTSYAIIKGNAPVYEEDGVTYPGELFMTSAYGGTKDCTAASLVKFVPAGDGYYYIYWIASEMYLADAFNVSSTSTSNVAYATKVYFVENGEGQFEIKTSGGANIIHDLTGYLKPKTGVNKATWDSSTMGGLYFTIFNASTDIKVAIEALEKAIASAEERIERYNGEINGDEGEYAALLKAIEEGKALVAAGGTAADYSAAEKNLNNAVFNYVLVKLQDLTESIYELTDSDDIIWFDEVPVVGGYPSKELLKLEDIYYSVIEEIYGVTGIGELETYIEYLDNELTRFHATQVKELKPFPYYAADAQGLPGQLTSLRYYVWESPVYALDKAVDGVRITFTRSRGGEEYNGFPIYAFAELGIYTPDGEKVDLTAYDITTNSESTTGPLEYICDGSTGTVYQSATGGDVLVAPTSEVYVEITFPTPLQAFYIKHTSKDQFALPMELALTSKGDLYTKHLFSENTWNAVLGEQVTDANDIKEGNLYAIRSASDDSYWVSGTDKFDAKVLRGECAFRFEKNSDGTFHIKSLASASYWADIEVEQNVYGVVFDECAANLVIEEGSEEGSFYMYTEKSESDLPYFAYQSGKNHVNVLNIASIDYLTKESEWLIYNITMDNPDYLYLSNIKKAISEGDIKTGTAPGFFKEIGNGYTDALNAVNECLKNKDKAKAAEVAAMIDKAIEEIDDNSRNTITEEAEYRIQSAFKPFYDNQGVCKYLQFNQDYAMVVYNTCGNEPDETWYYTFEKDETDVNTYIMMCLYEPYYYLGSSNGYLEPLDFPTTFDVTRIAGSAKYRISDYFAPGRYLCASTHQDGRNSWAIAQFESINSNPEATKWYIVDDNTVASEIKSVAVEGDAAISTVYYTVGGQMSEQPVKGLNIIKTVHANGVVTIKKVLVK